MENYRNANHAAEEEQQYSFDKDDLLGRKNFADFLLRLVQNNAPYRRGNDYKSYVIAIDSPWGSGKTRFLNMFINYMRENDLAEPQNTFIYYNAWKNDYWSNGFEPLADTIFTSPTFFNEKGQADRTKLMKEVARAAFRIAKCLGQGFFLNNLDKFIGKDTTAATADILEDTLVDGFLTKQKSLFPEFNEFKNSIAELKKFITSYIESFEPEKQLIIVIDELDRCKPSFAIQTLEFIKHIFDIKNMVFLIAIDTEQIQHAVASVYGQGFNSTGYLLRFFNYYVKMPPASAVQHYAKNNWTLFCGRK